MASEPTPSTDGRSPSGRLLHAIPLALVLASTGADHLGGSVHAAIGGAAIVACASYGAEALIDPARRQGSLVMVAVALAIAVLGLELAPSGTVQDPEPKVKITFPAVDDGVHAVEHAVRGTVENLPRGAVVWPMTRQGDTLDVYPASGQCPVTGTRWDCEDVTDVYFGGPASDHRRYTLLVVVADGPLQARIMQYFKRDERNGDGTRVPLKNGIPSESVVARVPVQRDDGIATPAVLPG